MNRFQRDFSGEAQLEYGDADYLILTPGAYVVCAVTGQQIPLQQLKYWSAELQEAYADGQAATKRWLEANNRKEGAS